MIRSIFLSLCLLLTLAFFGFSAQNPQKPATGAALSFEQRVAYQRAIEEVYWRHSIWPQENKSQKPSLDQVMPEFIIRAKVEDYLKKSNSLAVVFQRPVKPDQLQSEINRMLKNTKQPQILRELFAALGNDPRVIAECLARPLLVDRLIHSWYTNDERFHGPLKQQIEAELRGANLQSIRALSGRYSETEMIKGTLTNSPGANGGLNVNEGEWNERLTDLAGLFGSTSIRGKQQSNILPVGKLSGLREDPDRFYVATVLEKQNDHIKTAFLEWPKRPFGEWWLQESTRITSNIVEEPHFYTLLSLSTPSSCDDSWTETQASFPTRRYYHTAVWTGTEMIVWGGYGHTGYLSSGARYNPSTDTWTATSSSNAPQARRYHTAVWTGTQMIVWGGYNGSSYPSSGARYDPSTDTWTPISSSNAPEGRLHHTTVWTGSEMIVWGGSNDSGLLSNASRYNPSTDSWTGISTSNAPEARVNHTAIWSGSEMMIWGGFGVSGALNNGGRYDPLTDSWASISNNNAPPAVHDHTAVWTGTQMIIWGGHDNSGYRSTGGRYDPFTDSWSPTSNNNSPDARSFHTAIWTGAAMIVWGGNGNSGPLSIGSRYDPSADNWNATSNANSLEARYSHTAVWTGTEMIVWGGYDSNNYFSSGGRYDPSADSWIPTSSNHVPDARSSHTAVWTGTHMIVWGGFRSGRYLSSGSRYDPSTDSWTPTSTTNAPEGRYVHTAVWTGTHMIVWGGFGNGQYLSSGSRYDPSTDSWSPTSTTNAPEARSSHTAVWTGTHMIIWGGSDNGVYLADGSRYNPSTDSWSPTNNINAPEARGGHTAIWNSTQMIVWGGFGNSGYLSNGNRYDPSTDSWSPMSTSNVPEARWGHTAVWTGTQMIVWGGLGTSGNLSSGGRYDPSINTWTPTTSNNAPVARSNHLSIWTGSEMVTWGGTTGNSVPLSSGGRYDPTADIWTTTSNSNAPEPRYSHTAIWTGSEMIVWGGNGNLGLIDTGGRYCVASLLPNVSISDASISEGNSGTKNLNFDVTLSAAALQDVIVYYTTQDNTATNADNDYAAANSSITIVAGNTTGTIHISVNGDTKYEHNEQFFVNLTSATNTTINDGHGVGTINNDDTLPVITINDQTVTEPASGSGFANADFTVTISPVSGADVQVNYATANGTATSESDYVAIPTATLTIPAGATTGIITVNVLGDGHAESNETFFVNLSSPVDVTIGDSQAKGKISNRMPELSINDISFNEGNSGKPVRTFTVTTSFAYDAPITVFYATADGTAIHPGDYSKASGNLNIAANALSAGIGVPVSGDTVVEPNETFMVNLSSPKNATISDSSGIATILNDDVSNAPFP